MSRAKGVHHVAVGIAGQRLGKLLLRSLHGLLGLVVLGSTFLYAHGLAFLFGIEAQVLEQQGLAHLQGSSLLLSLGTVGSESHGNAESLLYSLADLAQRLLHIHLALGLAHVAHDDGGTTVGQNLLQCGQGTGDAGVVRNLTILV